VLRGVKVYAKNPFRFDFILDPGDDSREADELKEEANRLIRYFLASLTIPQEDLWVNLSPYEKEHIITDAFGRTGMGRDLLEQDYLLKQITASAIYPEDKLGKDFWGRVYEKAFEKYGTTDIPLDTFNKVWVMPRKAVVYEKIPFFPDNGDAASGSAVAYVAESGLKVMLENDYLAESKEHGAESQKKNGTNVTLEKNPDNNFHPSMLSAPSSMLARQVLKEIVIPALEEEVNTGRNFAALRQVYNSLILAVWYKKKIKSSLMSSVYVDQRKVQGVDINDPKEAEKIWSRYVDAFKKGAFNFIKEEYDRFSHELVPRKYFSGGFDFAQDSLEPVLEYTADLSMATGEGMRTILIESDVEPIRTSDQAMAFPSRGVEDLGYARLVGFVEFMDLLRSEGVGLVGVKEEEWQAVVDYYSFGMNAGALLDTADVIMTDLRGKGHDPRDPATINKMVQAARDGVKIKEKGIKKAGKRVKPVTMAGQEFKSLPPFVTALTPARKDAARRLLLTGYQVILDKYVAQAARDKSGEQDFLSGLRREDARLAYYFEKLLSVMHSSPAWPRGLLESLFLQLDRGLLPYGLTFDHNMDSFLRGQPARFILGDVYKRQAISLSDRTNGKSFSSEVFSVSLFSSEAGQVKGRYLERARWLFLFKQTIDHSLSRYIKAAFDDDYSILSEDIRFKDGRQPELKAALDAAWKPFIRDFLYADLKDIITGNGRSIDSLDAVIRYIQLSSPDEVVRLDREDFVAKMGSAAQWESFLDLFNFLSGKYAQATARHEFWHAYDDHRGLIAAFRGRRDLPESSAIAMEMQGAFFPRTRFADVMMAASLEGRREDPNGVRKFLNYYARTRGHDITAYMTPQGFVSIFHDLGPSVERIRDFFADYLADREIWGQFAISKGSVDITYDDKAMAYIPEVPQVQPDPEELKGGIDLTFDDFIDVRNSGKAFVFDLDPAKLEQLRQAPGFIPVINRIKLLESIPQFLTRD
jgi:hypothetical protein